MKKLLSLLMIITALAVVSPQIQAQESSFSPKMVIKTNPLSALGGPFWFIIVPLTGEYKVLLEAKTLPKQSVTFGISYIGPSLLLNLDDITDNGVDISGVNTGGYKVQGMYKFYLNRDSDAIEGLYMAPHVAFATASITSKDNPEDVLTGAKLNVHGLIGYQLISEGGFALDIYTGLGFRTLAWDLQGNSNNIFDIGGDRTGATVPFGVSFGYAF